MQDEWWDLFEVRMAERLSGGDPAVFVETLIDLIDSGLMSKLRAELDRRGLSLDDVMEMRHQVALDVTEGRGKLPSATKSCVKRLFLAQFDVDQIADLLDVESDRIGPYIAQYIDVGSREIILQHLAGKTPRAIASNIGCSRQRVVDLIRDFGQEPVRERGRITASEREQVRKLRLEGGLGYSTIAEKVGVDYYAVRNCCRNMAKATT